MTVKLVGSTSGSVSLQAPASTTGGAHRVLTLPDANGTIATTTTGGKLLQVVQTVKKDVFSTTVTPGTISGDITGLTLSITPSNASNKILIDCHVNGGFIGSTGMYAYLYKNGSVLTDATGNDGGGTTVRASFQSQGGTLLDLEDVHGQFLDTAGGTSAITYSLRIQHPYTESSFAGTLYINRTGDSDETKTNYVFPRTISTITATEIAA